MLYSILSYRKNGFLQLKNVYTSAVPLRDLKIVSSLVVINVCGCRRLLCGGP